MGNEVVPDGMLELTDYKVGILSATIVDDPEEGDEYEHREVVLVLSTVEVKTGDEAEATVAIPLRFIRPLVQDVYDTALNVVGLGDDDNDEADGYVNDTEEDA